MPVYPPNSLPLLLKKTAFALSLALPILVQAQTKPNYWKQHIAVLGATMRTIGADTTILEIALVDFKKTERLESAFGLGLNLFTDDGQGFDRYPADAIYTAQVTGQGTRPLSFGPGIQVSSSHSFILIDREFEHKSLALRLLRLLQWFCKLPTPEILLECQLKHCPCPGACLCVACEWGPANWCLDWCSCSTDTVHR